MFFPPGPEETKLSSALFFRRQRPLRQTSTTRSEDHAPSDAAAAPGPDLRQGEGDGEHLTASIASTGTSASPTRPTSARSSCSSPPRAGYTDSASWRAGTRRAATRPEPAHADLWHGEEPAQVRNLELGAGLGRSSVALDQQVALGGRNEEQMRRGRLGRLGRLDELQLRELAAQVLDLVLQPAVLGLEAVELGIRLGVGRSRPRPASPARSGRRCPRRFLRARRLIVHAASLAVAPVDLGPEAGAEAALGLELDAVLLGEGYRQRRAGDVAALDEDRAQQPAACRPAP